MSMAMAVRLVLGLICGGTLTWAVWDRSERELADRAGREEHERPRFLPFGGYYYLPMMMLLYPILGVIAGGAQMFAFQNKSSMVRVGERNVEATKAKLKQLNIPILAEDTGKDFGRTVIFYPETGEFQIKAVGKETYTI